MFSITTIYIPINIAQGFPFLHILTYTYHFGESHSKGMRRHVTAVLIRISLALNEVEHLCMYLLVICMSSLEKCLFKSAHFSTGLFVFVFLMLICMSCLYILDINSLSLISLENIFSHSVGCLFVLSMISFVVQKLLSLIRSHLFFLRNTF